MRKESLKKIQAEKSCSKAKPFCNGKNGNGNGIYIPHFLYVYTAVSTKVVQKKRKSIRDNAERYSGKYPINFYKSSDSIMPRELDDETVNYHNTQFPSELSRKLQCFYWTTFLETAVFKCGLHPTHES